MSSELDPTAYAKLSRPQRIVSAFYDCGRKAFVVAKAFDLPPKTVVKVLTANGVHVCACRCKNHPDSVAAPPAQRSERTLVGIPRGIHLASMSEPSVRLLVAASMVTALADEHPRDVIAMRAGLNRTNVDALLAEAAENGVRPCACRCLNPARYPPAPREDVSSGPETVNQARYAIEQQLRDRAARRIGF
ncbi:hypothetical protein NLX83_31895 [Allokutzneria sp. A3M-2-11 16]|uniref:hypothetical protein n=1 Tax=Allokutzneria sp. A3M-2-11 16 TaxID=2962043 RepID=UPI0020B8367E|nr:hypothetical protein [Allokutzneria sp. A3M-2-11 16]MCP3803882.1 hypothetical protein [Allokutzneria sp. A3M-2-11 16]